jgi:hypothetical protein
LNARVPRYWRYDTKFKLTSAHARRMAAGNAPTHPYRGGGIALLVLGIVFIIGGIAAYEYCSVSLLGVCLDYPYQAAGGGIAALGFVLLIVGIVLSVISKPAPAPVMSAQPQTVYYVTSPPQPIPPPPTPAAERYCQSCGMGNARAAAFCQKCGKPLPTPP